MRMAARMAAEGGWAAEEGCQGWLMRDGRCRFLLGWLLRMADADGC